MSTIVLVLIVLVIGFGGIVLVSFWLGNTRSGTALHAPPNHRKPSPPPIAQP